LSSAEFLSHLAQLFETPREFVGSQVDDLKKENASLKMEVVAFKTQVYSLFIVVSNKVAQVEVTLTSLLKKFGQKQ
jgi:hypothetical protein